jgi:hypothetical protein
MPTHGDVGLFRKGRFVDDRIDRPDPDIVLLAPFLGKDVVDNCVESLATGFCLRASLEAGLSGLPSLYRTSGCFLLVRQVLYEFPKFFFDRQHILECRAQSDFVDDGCRVVFLILGGETQFAQIEPLLLSFLLLAVFRNRRSEFGFTPPLDMR